MSYLYYLWIAVLVLLFLYTLGYILFWAFATWQGNARFELETERASGLRIPAGDADAADYLPPVAGTNWTIEKVELRRLHLRNYLVLKNVGREQGTVMDCFGRCYLPDEYVKGVRAWTHVTDMNKPRKDDYWESILVPAKTSLTLQIDLTLEITEGNLRDAVEKFPDMDIDIIYQVVSRTDWEYDKQRIVLKGDELRREYLTKGGRAR